MQLKQEDEKKMLADLKNEMSSNEDMDLDQKNEQVGATMVRKNFLLKFVFPFLKSKIISTFKIFFFGMKPSKDLI